MSSVQSATAGVAKHPTTTRKRKSRTWENGRGDQYIVNQGWSWPAFFFGIFWFAYKKMWFPTVTLLICIAFLVPALGGWFDSSIAYSNGMLMQIATFGNVIFVVAHVFFGFFGNRMFERHLLERNFRMSHRSGKSSQTAKPQKSVTPIRVQNPDEVSEPLQIDLQPETANTIADYDDTVSADNTSSHVQRIPSTDTIALSHSSQAHDSTNPLTQQVWNESTPVEVPGLTSRRKRRSRKDPNRAANPKANPTAMSMTELDEMFGVNDQRATSPDSSPESASDDTPDSTQPNTQYAADEYSSESVTANDNNSTIEVAESADNKQSETNSMLGFTTKTEQEKFVTIAWMEITSGDVDQNIWTAVARTELNNKTVESAYVEQRVAQLVNMQSESDFDSDFVEYNSEVDEGTYDDSLEFEDEDDIHLDPDAAQIPEGNDLPDTVNRRVALKSVESEVLADTDSSINLNDVKNVVNPPHPLNIKKIDSARSDRKPDTTTGDSPTLQTKNVETKNDDHHDLSVNKLDATEHLTDQIDSESRPRVQESASIDESSDDDQSPNTVTTSLDKAVDTASDKEVDPDQSRRLNALHFIHSHLERLDEQKQEISAEELERLLKSADCELLELDSTIKVKDWDGNVIPSASLAGISRTISHLIWTHDET